MTGFQKCFSRVLFIGAGALFAVLAFFTAFPAKNIFFMQDIYPLKVLCFAIMVFFLVVSGEHIARKLRLSDFLVRHYVRVTLGTLLVAFVFQMAFATIAHTEVGWDVGAIMWHAENNFDRMEYFKMYPNNWILLLACKALRKVFSLFGWTNYWLGAIYINLICIDLAIAFMTFVAGMLFGKKVMYRVLLMQLLVIGLSPNLLVPYSDTLGMPFVPFLLWLFLIIKKDTTSLPRKGLLWIVWSFAAVLGIAVKPTVVIFFIACGIVAALFYPAVLKKNWNIVLAACAIFICIAAAFNSLIWRTKLPFGSMEEWKEKQFPLAHFFLLGTYEDPKVSGIRSGVLYGMWNQGDVDFSSGIAGKSERAAADIQRAIERLQGYGLGGTIRHYFYKTLWTGADGAFSYGLDGGVTAHGATEKTPDGLRGFLQNATYAHTDFYKKWVGNWHQGCWFFVCVCFSLMLALKPSSGKRGKGELILLLSGLGLIAFSVLFEGRARYLFIFLPVYITFAMCMLERAAIAVKEKGWLKHESES